ncbi:MAG: hypothetical protein GVY29_05975 [Spirochaetes bacterium]|nr:hypothetical protein [Spirochaetota bacterium]
MSRRYARLISMMVVLALAVTGLALAESVMVSVRPNEEYPDSERLSFYLSSVEAGIMDVLFDVGHIVFNRARTDAVESTAQVVEIASNGGAGYVVDAVVSFRPTQDGLELGEITYAWTPIGTGTAPRRSTVAVDQLDEEQRESTEQSGYSLGYQVGLDIADKLR